MGIIIDEVESDIRTGVPANESAAPASGSEPPAEDRNQQELLRFLDHINRRRQRLVAD